MKRISLLALLPLLCGEVSAAVTNVFFNAAQTAGVTASNINSITIKSGGYLFTYSVDGYWSPAPGGTPTGRFFTVIWPSGVQAQAITTGPLLGQGANITVKRADGNLFDLQSFTGKILLNTAGAGAAFEIMPLIHGNDGLPDPLQFDCTGYGGQSFSYTPALIGYDTYKIHMWGDFALTALALVDTNSETVPTNTITVSVSPLEAGVTTGAGNYPSNSLCTLTAIANSGFVFSSWAENGADVSTSAEYTFTVTSNRSLVAVFATNTPPLAFGGNFYQLTNTPLAINIADVMANDYDPDGDPVVFTGASATTSNGLPITAGATQLSIPANSIADAFTYTITDNNGGTSTGTVRIGIITNAAGEPVSLDLNSIPGSVIGSFSGVPWYNYTIERATNATFTGSIQTWPMQAWADGSISLWDDFNDLGGQPAQAFYRLSYP